MTSTATPEWVELAPTKDASRKSFRFWRKLLPLLRLGVRLAPWLAGPVVTSIFVLAVLGAVAATPVHPLITFGFAVAVPAAAIVTNDGLRTFYSRLPEVAATSVYELFTWPYLCGLAGFVQAANGRLTYAKLLRVAFKGDGVRRFVKPDVVQLDVAPGLQHDRSTWDKYEERIGRYHKAGTSFWQPSPLSDNAMRITVRRTRLPRMHTVGPGRIGRQHSNLDHMPSDEVYLGIGADGDPMVWHPDESGRGSIFVAGRKGGGKGQILRAIQAHGLAAERAWRFTVLNPKRVGEYRWLTGHAVVEKEPAAMFTALAAFRAEMERRADVLDEVFGVASYLDAPLAELEVHGMANRWCLMVDELAVFSSLRGVVQPPEKPTGHKGPWRPLDPYQAAMTDLAAITAMDRAMGMSSIVATQHPIAEHLGPFGSTLKSNLGGRIGTGFLEPEGAAALFGKSNGGPVSDVLRAGIPGRQVFEGLTTTEHGRWMSGQGVYIDDVTPFVPATSAWEPRDFASELVSAPEFGRVSSDE